MTDLQSSEACTTFHKLVLSASWAPLGPAVVNNAGDERVGYSYAYTLAWTGVDKQGKDHRRLCSFD
jgi:hypothetical protein